MGLRQCQGRAVVTALNPVVEQPIRDEACGVAHQCDVILELESTITDLLDAIRPEE